MTMIAFHAAEKQAHLMTDSISYNRNGTRLGHTTKRMPLDHLDAVVATQGDSQFGNAAAHSLHATADQTPALDALLALAPDMLRKIRDDFPATEAWREALADNFVAIVGWSPAMGRFVGAVMHSRRDYEPEYIFDELFVFPTPWSGRPRDWEVEHFLEHYDDTAEARAAVTNWQRRAPLRPPAEDQWAALATQVRNERSRQHHGGTTIAGTAYLTKLRRGYQCTREALRFNDFGAEWLEVLRGTEHPIAQMAACHCGSGKRTLDCCLRDQLDQPCNCGSGDPFSACCSIDRHAATEALA